MPIRVYRSLSRDVFLNLALEDRLFRTFGEDERILFLWRNEKAVVIGRYQNPWLECRAEEIERDGIALARRQSGGGAVWHDPGNLCFTFMGRKPGFDREENIGLVVRSLRRLGVEAEANDRLDILVGGKKVSGSAFRETGGRSFHHGTLLVSADLTALDRYLAGGGPAHRAKGVRSVRSPVANLSESVRGLTVETVERAIAAQAREAWGRAGTGGIEDLDDGAMGAEGDVAAYRARLAGREWRFDSSPPFSRRIGTGAATLTLDIEGGTVRNAVLEIAGGAPEEAGDAAETAEAVAAALIGREYRESEIAAALRSLGSSAAENGKKAADGASAARLYAVLGDALERGLFT